MMGSSPSWWRSLPACSPPLRPPELAALPYDQQVPYRLKAGRPVVGVDLKIVDENGKTLPNDGKAAMQKPAKGKAMSHKARGSYAQGQRRRGASSIAADPIKRSGDDPRMYGKPDRN